jgi:hypothetical protein
VAIVIFLWGQVYGSNNEEVGEKACHQITWRRYPPNQGLTNLATELFVCLSRLNTELTRRSMRTALLDHEYCRDLAF